MALHIPESSTARSSGFTIGLDTPTDLLFVRYTAADRHHRLASAAHRRGLRRRLGA